MKLPIKSYEWYWLKNSAMALATGTILGYFTTLLIIILYDPLYNCLIGAILTFLIGQIIIFNRFSGSRRGYFEYEFKNETIEHGFGKIIYNLCGLSEYTYYIFNGQLTSVRQELSEKLLNNERLKNNVNNLFVVLVNAADTAAEDNKDKKEFEYLFRALNIKPTDAIANLKMGIAYENNERKEDAINYYETALNDSNNSKQFNKYILSQIDRVKMEGCKKHPLNNGLRFLLW
jgi:tetratricopeptide (TPR) repeat protein